MIGNAFARRLGLVAAVGILAACNSGSIGGPPLVTPPPASPTAPTTGTLAVYDARNGLNHVVTVVEISGPAGVETAKVVSTATLARRTPVPPPFCVSCSVPVEPPAVSTSKRNIYVLDGDATVKMLSLDGRLSTVASIPGTASARAAFAISPDDSQIAVGVIDHSSSPSASGRLYVENLGGGGHVDIYAPSPHLYWPIGWRNGQIVLATEGSSQWNPYGASGYALIDPVAGAQPTPVSSTDCVPTGLLSPAGTACVSGIGSPCLGNLVSQSGPYSYYSSCLRRLDWTGKETVFLLPNYYQTSSMVGNPAALSADGTAIITDWLFVALEPDANGFGGNQFVLGYGNPSSEQDVGWIDGHYVTWSYMYPDGTSGQRLMRIGDDYGSAANIPYDGFPIVAGAPQSPVHGNFVATLPEAL